MREPDGTTDLLCPRCPHRVWVSPEDPDASQSEMVRHLLTHTADYTYLSAMKLLEKVEEVPADAHA